MEVIKKVTRKEFGMLAKGMKAAYAQTTFLPDAEAMDIWYAMLKDLDYRETSIAIQMHMQSSKFPPTIAEIRSNIARIKCGDVSDWSKAWEETCKVLRKYGRANAQKALQELDSVTRTVVKRIGYINLCNSENPIADRANFRSIYETVANREVENAKLSASVRDALGFTERMQLGESL